MKSYFSKILFLSLILLSQIEKVHLIEDEDLKIEDEKKNPEIKKKKIQSRNSRFQEDSDEFDDPNLLNEHNNKMQNNEFQKEIPTNTNNSEPKYDEENEEEKKDIINLILNKYLYEFSMGSFLLIFILNVLYGKKKNKKIAFKWYNQNKDFFINNYAHIGTEREFNPKKTDTLIYESYNEYKFFSSGRIYINWMLVDILLKRRQDLLSMLSGMFLFPEKDKIMYESVIIPQNEIPVVFCICKKKNAKTMKKNYNEIDSLQKLFHRFLNDNLIIFTENTEFILNIFKQNELLSEYKKIEKYIDTIFFTDGRNSKDNYAIIVSFEC